jgi:hypothetical protein
MPWGSARAGLGGCKGCAGGQPPGSCGVSRGEGGPEAAAKLHVGECTTIPAAAAALLGDGGEGDMLRLQASALLLLALPQSARLACA